MKVPVVTGTVKHIRQPGTSAGGVKRKRNRTKITNSHIINQSDLDMAPLQQTLGTSRFNVQ